MRLDFGTKQHFAPVRSTVALLAAQLPRLVEEVPHRRQCARDRRRNLLTFHVQCDALAVEENQFFDRDNVAFMQCLMFAPSSEIDVSLQEKSEDDLDLGRQCLRPCKPLQQLTDLFGGRLDDGSRLDARQAGSLSWRSVETGASLRFDRTMDRQRAELQAFGRLGDQNSVHHLDATGIDDAIQGVGKFRVSKRDWLVIIHHSLVQLFHL